MRQKLGLLGSLLTPEKEVILVVTRAAQTSAVFEAMAEAGQIRVPGKGLLFVTKVGRVLGFVQPGS